MNEILALAAIVATGLSGVLAALVGYRTRLGDRVFATAMLLGSSSGLVAAFRSLSGVGHRTWKQSWSVPGGALELELDALSAMFLAQICLIAALAAIYGLGYWPAHENPRTAGRLRLFIGWMVAGMALVVVARNAVLFLVGWEVMAIAAFLAITAEDDRRETRVSGFVYLVATRVGTLLVYATFLVLRSASGSFSLSLAGLDGATGRSAAVFLLGLAGFGLKAGLMPLHVWLPGAHANAPTHVSALMSGVLIKMGAYGLFRVCSFFTDVPVWWGLLLLALGVISAVLGVAFAIGQHDLKRLLAYHSVENIGIIVMGFGIAILGRATGHPGLVALGLAGALLHTWNHGLFKALLFLSAGSVIHATHTREIDKLGGLLKVLPRTSFAFLVGAVAICGLPPLNGFVSELFVYLAMLDAGSLDLGPVSIAAVLGVPLLAAVGALAALCFAKVFGVVFLGVPRSAGTENVRESPWTMQLPMAVLAGCCVAIGALPPLVAPVLERASSAWTGAAPPEALVGLAPLRPLVWTNLLLAAGLVLGALSMRRALAPARVVRGPTWGCGFLATSPRMQYTASSFGDWIVAMFGVVLRPRTHRPSLGGPFPEASRFESHVPEVVLDLGIVPAGRRLGRLTVWFRWLQQGQVQLYLLYVLGALLLMLFVWR